MDKVNAMRDQVERAMLEVEDNIEPFRGKQVTRNALIQLSALATALRKTLQDGHLYLAAHDADEYDANFRTKVTECRRLLSAFLVETEEQKAARAAEFAAADTQATATAAAEAENQRKLARQEIVVTRVARVLDEAKQLREECEAFCTTKATTDEQLYEKAEAYKVLCGCLEAVTARCKEAADLALGHDLLKESGEADVAASGLGKLRLKVDQAMLASRKGAGVWAEKGWRTTARGDQKMPSFSGAATDKLTVYEFEKDWVAYKVAAGLTVEESVKELRVAVQPPARAAIQKMESEEAVFTYLKAHYGNPFLLLNAREEEMRGWAPCKGSDVQCREWLIHAKERLEATVALCTDHNILKYMHFSSIAAIVQSKLPDDMVRDFKKILVKQLSPSGVLEKEIIIGLLIKFLDEKIMDSRHCRLFGWAGD
jgi:hypothetical protein